MRKGPVGIFCKGINIKSIDQLSVIKFFLEVMDFNQQIQPA